MEQPSESTGDQANQLHHTESGRDELGIAHPGGGAINRGTAGLVGEEAGNFGIGEGLDEAHHHGDGPDQKRHLAGGARNAADGEQDERRNAARHPEGSAPVDGAFQLTRLPKRNGRRSFHGHVCNPSRLA